MSSVSSPTEGLSPAALDVMNRADLVTANHILADQGVLDGFGHVSVRSVQNPNHFFISRSRAPALVTADDLMTYDLDDHAIDAQGRRSYLERFIHAEIYRARPDVMAVVHSHSPAVIPFSVSNVALRPVSHMGGFLRGLVPVFEIRDVDGEDNDMLIRTARLGAALAQALGQGAVVLMRGHGNTVVGPSLKAAVFRAVYTESNARLQTAALQLGGQVTYLNAHEAAAVADENERQIERPWEIWKQQADRHAR